MFCDSPAAVIYLSLLVDAHVCCCICVPLVFYVVLLYGIVFACVVSSVILFSPLSVLIVRCLSSFLHIVSSFRSLYLIDILFVFKWPALCVPIARCLLFVFVVCSLRCTYALLYCPCFSSVSWCVICLSAILFYVLSIACIILFYVIWIPSVLSYLIWFVFLVFSVMLLSRLLLYSIPLSYLVLPSFSSLPFYAPPCYLIFLLFLSCLLSCVIFYFWYLFVASVINLFCQHHIVCAF